MFEQLLRGLYCLHVLVATESVQLGMITGFQKGAYENLLTKS